MRRLGYIILCLIAILIILTITSPQKVSTYLELDSNYSQSSNYEKNSYANSDDDEQYTLFPYSFYSLHNKINKIFNFIMFIIAIIIIISLKHYANIERIDNILKYYSFDPKTLKQNLYDRFLEVQECFMNFDYKSLKRICSKELYDSYNNALKKIESVDAQYIIKDFKNKQLYITDIEKQDENIYINVKLNIKHKDYIINTKTNEVIDGNENVLYKYKYELKFKYICDTKNLILTDEKKTRI